MATYSGSVLARRLRPLLDLGKLVDEDDETISRPAPAAPSGLHDALRRAIEPATDTTAQAPTVPLRRLPRLRDLGAPDGGRPWDERLPDGTPAIDVAIPKWQRPGSLFRRLSLPESSDDGSAAAPAGDALKRPQLAPLPPSDSPISRGLLRAIPEAMRPPSSGPTPDVVSEVPRLSRPVPPPASASSSLQPLLLRRGLGQEPSDRAIVPVAERQDAVFREGGVGEPSAMRLGKTTQETQTLDRSAYDRRRAQIEKELTDLLGLQNTKAVDKNGRLKSVFWGILQGFLRGGLGGAITGGIYGGVHPEWDEELKQVAEVAKREGKLDHASKLESQLADLDRTYATADAYRVKNSPEALNTRQRMALHRELQALIKLTGGKFDPNNPRQAEIADLLDTQPRNKPGGINWQRVKSVTVGGRDHLVYLDIDPDTNEVVYRKVNPAGGVEDFPADQQSAIRNAIALEGVNVNRGRIGQGPLKINEPPTIQRVAPGQLPPFIAAPGEPSAAPVTRPAPVLVPTGEPAPALPRRSYGRVGGRGAFRRGGAGSSDSRTEEIRDSQEARYAGQGDNARTRAAAARTRAEAARGRGEDAVARRAEEEAAAADREAATADNNLERIRGRRGAGSAPARRAVSPGDAAQIVPGVSPATGRGLVKRSNFLKNNPQYRRKSQREIDAMIREDGYEPIP